MRACLGSESCREAEKFHFTSLHFGAIPQAVIAAARATVKVAEGMYVAFTPEDMSPTYYARAESDSSQPGTLKYHIQMIDTFGTPHDTGKYVSAMQALRTPMTEAVLWVEEAEEDAHYTFQNNNTPQDDDDDDKEPPRVYIIGPVSYTHLTLPTNREV